ncbi:MAG: cation diffusion facilitator family transporter [Paludibacteraceae bacterium]|nr:cation diffusion facilitator family transporter [Paludibacteraceae bacterium]
MTSNEREKEIYKVTIVGSLVNFLLLLFKFVSGVVGHSAAMIADAVHSLSDFVTDILVLVFVKVSSKPADTSHRYGHGKFETLATAIIGVVLFVVSIGIFYQGATAIYSVYKGAVLPLPGYIALAAAALSIVAKEAVYWYTTLKGKKLNSQAVVANAWHHRSDALSSIGTLLGIGGAIIGGQKWAVLDPIAAVIVSIFIAKVAVSILHHSLQDLLEHALPMHVQEEIKQVILSVEGVSAPHHLRTRRIGNQYAIEVHIRVDGNLTLHEAHQITSDVEKKLKEKYGESINLTIHTEPIK